MRTVLPADIQVFTRAGARPRTRSRIWTTRTATGLIFGSGLVVAFVVGIMVLYQTLATQITRQLPQFATLKAIGYTNRFLDGIVLIEAVLIDAWSRSCRPWRGAGDLRGGPAADTAAGGDDRDPARRGLRDRALMAVGDLGASCRCSGLRRADPADIF